jgi:predicted RNA-binding protein
VCLSTVYIGEKIDENIVAREANIVEAENSAVKVTDIFGESQTFQDCIIKAVELSGGHVILTRSIDS